MSFFGLLGRSLQAIYFFLKQHSLWLWLHTSNNWTTDFKKINQSSCLVKCIDDFLIFQQAVIELHHFHSSISHSPKFLCLWLTLLYDFFLSQLPSKNPRIMLSGWVISVMKVELFMGNGSKNICMVNLYAQMSRCEILLLSSSSSPAVFLNSFSTSSSTHQDT